MCINVGMLVCVRVRVRTCVLASTCECSTIFSLKYSLLYTYTNSQKYLTTRKIFISPPKNIIFDETNKAPHWFYLLY